MKTSKNKKNILHCISGLEGGGAERALYNLLSQGIGDKYRNAVISLSSDGIYGEKIRSLGVPVYSLDIHGARSFIAGVLQLRKIAKISNPSIIQGWMYHGNLAATLARMMIKNKPPVIWNIRQCLYQLSVEKLLTQQVIRLNRFASKWPDGIIYNSRLSKNQHEKLGFYASKSIVIPNGFDLNIYGLSTKARNTIRERLNIPINAYVVGHVARFHPMKDHIGFIKAASLALRHRNDIHYILVGRNVSNDNSELLNAIPKEYEGLFHLLGEREDVPRLMQTMDLFCQSSWSEAFPNVLGEAMASGLPCVATNVGDSAMIIGDTGILVQPREYESLAEAILAMVSKSDNERRILSKKARKRIENKYALPHIVDKYSNLYNSL